MLFRTALVVVLMLASSPQSIAGNSYAGDCERTIATSVNIGETTEPRETMRLSNPVPDPLDDVRGGRERNPHSLQLMRIAIAISLGNRDVVEIASGELGKFGVTREEIQHFVDWTKLHSGPVSLGRQRRDVKRKISVCGRRLLQAPIRPICPTARHLPPLLFNSRNRVIAAL
jgi:hypothetical protein